MSAFIGAAMPTTILQMKDRRLVPNYQVIRRQRDRFYERSSATDRYGGWASDFWPGNRGFIGDQAVDVSVQQATWRSSSVARLADGVKSTVGFVGISRDYAGGALAGATCILFLTSTRAYQMETVSGSDGSFMLQTVHSPDAHFIVFHKPGTPNVFGATDNNLTGS